MSAHTFPVTTFEAGSSRSASDVDSDTPNTRLDTPGEAKQATQDTDKTGGQRSYYSVAKSAIPIKAFKAFLEFMAKVGNFVLPAFKPHTGQEPTEKMINEILAKYLNKFPEGERKKILDDALLKKTLGEMISGDLDALASTAKMKGDFHSTWEGPHVSEENRTFAHAFLCKHFNIKLKPEQVVQCAFRQLLDKLSVKQKEAIFADEKLIEKLREMMSANPRARVDIKLPGQEHKYNPWAGPMISEGNMEFAHAFLRKHFDLELNPMHVLQYAFRKHLAKIPESEIIKILKNDILINQIAQEEYIYDEESECKMDLENPYSYLAQAIRLRSQTGKPLKLYFGRSGYAKLPEGVRTEILSNPPLMEKIKNLLVEDPDKEVLKTISDKNMKFACAHLLKYFKLDMQPEHVLQCVSGELFTDLPSGVKEEILADKELIEKLRKMINDESDEQIIIVKPGKKYNPYGPFSSIKEKDLEFAHAHLRKFAKLDLLPKQVLQCVLGKFVEKTSKVEKDAILSTGWLVSKINQLVFSDAKIFSDADLSESNIEEAYIFATNFVFLEDKRIVKQAFGSHYTKLRYDEMGNVVGKPSLMAKIIQKLKWTDGKPFVITDKELTKAVEQGGDGAKNLKSRYIVLKTVSTDESAYEALLDFFNMGEIKLDS